ncbi:nucleoside hydrolase [Demequina sp. NBRC 110056]|uniref:nucleoside hydrolase n=1 Tax=Demequina sp. NBRC 110056 TaxID=1570345 RepID=UPI0009FD1E07|nr:nucleoside hydrolase [Demequina sp. NBRC 110056]
MTTTEPWSSDRIEARSRVVIDNDFCGDPDCVVEIAHHLLCRSIEIPFVVSSAVGVHHPEWTDDCVTRGVGVVREVAELADRDDVVVLEGSNLPMADASTPAVSAAAEALVREAMRDDTDLPLYVACGGGLTTVASALLLEPRIADRMTVIWLGGEKYDMTADELPPDVRWRETNVNTDMTASRVVFNDFQVPLWQMPQGVFSQALMSRSEAWSRVRSRGALGRHVFDQIGHRVDAWSRGLKMGEAYGLGDHTLVSLTALGGPYSPEPYTSDYTDVPRPSLLENGLYGEQSDAGTIRVYSSIDVRLLFEDFYGKLDEFAATRET